MFQSLAILSLGFMIGMGHALETDHLAAVSNMLARKGSRRELIARGVFWGLGHTLSLFVICSGVVLLSLSISGGVQAGLEFVVGVMIVALGALLVLTVNATQSIWQALLYFVVFGFGSMAGMAALSAVVCLPLTAAQRGTTWLRNGITSAIG